MTKHVTYRFKVGQRVRIKFGVDRGHYGTIIHLGGETGPYYGVMGKATRALWSGSRNCYVPKEVAVCPECKGELVARSMENEVATGRPVAAAIEFDCMNDGRGGIQHRYYQSDWQPIRDAVTKWSGARVDSVEPAGLKEFCRKALSARILDRNQLHSILEFAEGASADWLLVSLRSICYSHERLQQELDGMDALLRDEKAYASDLRKASQ